VGREKYKLKNKKKILPESIHAERSKKIKKWPEMKIPRVRKKAAENQCTYLSIRSIHVI